MKKILTIMLFFIAIFSFSCAKGRYSDEKLKIKNITLENYLDEVTLDGTTYKAYISSNSNRVFLFYKTKDLYKMRIKDSFYSQGLFNYDAKRIEEDPSYLDFSIKEELITYDLKENLLKDGDNHLKKEFTEAEFTSYCASRNDDVLISAKNIMYELINYFCKNSFIITFFKDPAKNMTYIEGEVEWYDMKKDKVFFNLIEDKLKDKEKNKLSEFLYGVCISVYGAPGRFTYKLYLSNDLTKVYPNLSLTYINNTIGNVTFYNIDLLEN